jgi:hypothetical protein
MPYLLKIFSLHGTDFWEANWVSAGQEFLSFFVNRRFIAVFKKLAICHYTEKSCMTSARNWELFCFYSDEKKSYVMINDIEPQMLINISQYRAVAIYCETEVQVFLKQFKQLTKIQNVLTEKQ